VSRRTVTAVPADQPDVVPDYARTGAYFLAAQGGDRAALDVLVQELTPLLWQVARMQGLDRDSSADVVQTVWLELLGSLTKIHSPNALVAWLITVTKRESWRLRRSTRDHRTDDEVALGQLPDPRPIPEDRLLETDRRTRLWTAVDQLPERCRTLLRIVAFSPRPDYSAVGRALNMPEGSIGPTRGRCLAKLRKLLTADPTNDWR
jgi:RNA polymerase sigma factor (sigma-70 family)